MGIPVGIQWRMISTGQPRKEIKEKDKVRAIHFEVESVHNSYAKKALADIYDHKKVEGFPLGIRLRFVPDFGRVSDSNDKVKLSTLIGLQAKFIKRLVVIQMERFVTSTQHYQMVDQSENISWPCG
jgi:hypothetical protein